MPSENVESLRVFLKLPLVQPTVDCHVRAARLFRTLRKKGITVRGAVDCVIAQICIDLNESVVENQLLFVLEEE